MPYANAVLEIDYFPFPSPSLLGIFIEKIDIESFSKFMLTDTCRIFQGNLQDAWKMLVGHLQDAL